MVQEPDWYHEQDKDDAGNDKCNTEVYTGSSKVVYVFVSGLGSRLLERYQICNGGAFCIAYC